MPKGVYKKSVEHIAKVVGNLKPGYGKGMKFPERSEQNSHFWRGEEIGYYGIHSWLRRKFGKADRCQNPHCLAQSDKFHWAKIKDKSYERKRENFWMLCQKCHAIYDDFKGVSPEVSKGNIYRRINLIDQRFGKLTVISVAGKNKWGNLKFLCKCDCGGQKIIASANLRDGRTKSCGCLAINNLSYRIPKGNIPWNKGL